MTMAPTPIHTPRLQRAGIAVAAVAAGLLLLTGCKPANSQGGNPAPPAPSAPPSVPPGSGTPGPVGSSAD